MANKLLHLLSKARRPRSLESRYGIARPLMAIFPILVLVLASACQPGTFEPPRVATVTAQADQPPTATAPPLIFSAPTPTADTNIEEPAESIADQVEPIAHLNFWATATDDSEVALLEQGIGDFTEATGIQVELVQVAPRLLPDLVRSAMISGTLPDLILHPSIYSHGWMQDGILDSDAATSVLNTLGRETFEPDSLAQLSTGDETSMLAALPSTGWQQLILYRTDWFDDLGLLPPNTFSNLNAAAEAIFQEDSPVSGIIVPTDSSLVSTQQVFEHMAIANGCRLVNSEGEVVLLHPACLEALEVYRAMINSYSPVGLQTDISALNGYLSGRTGIIITSPSVLPAIAGLDETALPSCQQCRSAEFLSSNTGIVTQLVGDGEYAQPVNYSEITALGITTVADHPAAETFAEYWFDTLYPQWLLVNPEQKVPMRRGTQGDESRFIDAWFQAPLVPGGSTLAEIFGEESAALLSQGTASADRWGVTQGQGALVSAIYEQLLFAPLLQDMLSGYFNSSETIVEMYLTAVDAVPGYEFPIQVAPTPTP